MGRITIRFAGICAHFPNPGLEHPKVQHRVVLPDVATFRMGIVQPPGLDFQAYFLQPHYPVFKKDGVLVDALPRILANGYLMRPCRITVPDAEPGQPLGPFPFGVPHLTEFVAGYEPSAEVVFGKRACCHFDVAHGAKFAASTAAGGAVVVTITIDTRKRPRVRFTPMDEDLTFEDLTFDSDTAFLEVFNAEPPQPILSEPQPISPDPPLVEDTPYDFLLHYETSTRGVPQRLKALTPGMNTGSLTNAPFSRVREALITLAEFVDSATGMPRRDALERLRADSLNPSCSNSQYP